MDSMKQVALGVGIGLALSAYLHHETRQKEQEAKFDALSRIETRHAMEQRADLPPVQAEMALAEQTLESSVLVRPSAERRAAHTFRIPQLVARVEQCFPNAVATVSASGQQRTYAELARRVRKAAAGFIKALKVAPGERIAILSMNSESYLEAFYSIPFAGALPVPLNIRLSIMELVDTLRDCEASVLLVDEPLFSYVKQMKESVPSLRSVVTLGALPVDIPVPDGSVSMETLIETHGPLKDYVEFEGSEAIPENVYGIFYTGGTSGKAKGVMLSHEGILFNAYTITHMVRYHEGIKYLHATPMFHLASSTAIFGVTMTGGTHVFIPKFTPEGVLRTIQDHKVTHALLVPSMFQMLLSVPNLREYDLRSVRYFNYGGSPMLEKVLLQAMKAFPGAKFIQGYGMTEASPLITFLGAEHHVVGSPLLNSVGQCVPHGELRILDENGREVPRNTVGEICYRGPNVMVGYYKMPESTEGTLRDGWLRTGDGGRMNEQGFLFICDRIKDIVVSGGETVYSQEVEQCLAKLDGVVQCAVIGIPDPVLVEKVAAIIVVKSPGSISEHKVVEHCRQRMAKYKCPRAIFFRTEPLPLSGAGKVLKTVLREPFWRDVKGRDATIYPKSDTRTSTYDNPK